ncbi:MAG TPA: MraY family glycosyltransferase [Phycisphaerales bacterium]|nr:MraY family glycosyltransferase [Phycisphaerales bacterium]
MLAGLLNLPQASAGFLTDLLSEQAADDAATRLSIFEGYIGVLIASFLVALLATPLLRRLAVANGIIDRPSDPRKVHKVPVAYLGGVAVFLGVMAGIFYSLVSVRFPNLLEFHKTKHLIDGEFHWPVPWSVLLGLTVICLVGVIDDVTGLNPRLKIAGQLVAAACLAIDNVGVRLAAGVLIPLARAAGMEIDVVGGVETLIFNVPMLGPVDAIYWTGTAVIGLAVVGLCNASNLIDGLDGLLSGTTAITSMGLLFIALGLALADDGPLDSQRVVLCLAVLGACLGFLPHNFNPASIFLGDAGSLLLGFCMCVLILTLGDTGKTHLVAAGLIAYMLPILDTILAIIRRKMEGRSISAADDQHIHHMLKRAFGVKKAVFVLYGIAGTFAIMAGLASFGRARVVYLLALILVSYVGVTAIKIARRRHIENQAMLREAGVAPGPVQHPPAMTPPAADGAVKV